MSKENRYPQGYLPKIAYHVYKGNVDSMLHFVEQQKLKYGEITEADKDVIRQHVSQLSLTN